jgi:hypothetical protein
MNKMKVKIINITPGEEGIKSQNNNIIILLED